MILKKEKMLSKKNKSITSSKTLILLFLFNSNLIFSQEFCTKIDSIVVLYVPWEMVTFLSLDEIDVRLFKEKKERHFIDSLVLTENLICFQRLEPYNLNNIDTRMLIDIYSQIGKITIKLDRYGNYMINDKFYFRNSALVKWINKYVTYMK
jgi:hypothetical protein